MMQDISEVLHLKPENRAISASKHWWQTYQRPIFRTLMFSFTGVVVLVVLSTAVWLGTWQGDAQFKLGKLFEEGSQLVPQNYTQAFHWYSQSAEKGDRHAQLKLAEMYAQGKGIHQDMSMAFTLYHQMAEQGQVDAQYQVGKMYLAGDGAARNIELGIQWLEKSAHQGSMDAAYTLGNIYVAGFGVDVDERRILSDDGVIYSNLQDGVSQDYKRAAMWYLKAATQGQADAQAALGMLYLEGHGVQRSVMTAYALEAIGAAKGSEKAMNLRNQILGRLTESQIMTIQPFIDHWVAGQSIIYVE